MSASNPTALPEPVWQTATLWEILFSPVNNIVSFVGAGGKSSALKNLALEADKKKQGLLLTTTTKMAWSQRNIAADYAFLNDQIPDNISKSLLLCGGKTADGKKITGITAETALLISKRFKNVSIAFEADGAAGGDLKFPASFEPVIPACSNSVVTVTSIDAFDQKLKHIKLHRREPFYAVFPVSEEELLSPKLMAAILSHPAGSFKGTRNGMKKIWFVNKADTKRALLEGKRYIKDVLSRNPGIDLAILGSLKKQTVLHWTQGETCYGNKFI